MDEASYTRLIVSAKAFWASVPSLRARLEGCDPLEAESDLIPDCNIHRDLYRSLLADESAGRIPGACRASFEEVRRLHDANRPELDATLDWWVRG